ncbi:MAG: prolyl aminopeptidase [Betaproteobacteria bacterium RIFCSPLOWO2_12_FULL_63_13]|nr:MAG: prolyl aminopeptidase [Betaproteobacteria bacterium RIFCSPLOWO2_12_FULL_63_13]
MKRTTVTTTKRYVDLFPEIEPYDEGNLNVSKLHTIHYEQCGNPKGKPLLFLHGGPGGGIDPIYRRYFEPKKWRIVLFDQRGCGRSRPFAELRENTTWDLVADIERLRVHLGIDRWVVFGGSWGSTLSLAYAEYHRERVKALVLRGIFLLRSSELAWFYQDGASRMFPDAWERYRDAIPHPERGDFISAYYRRLTSANEKVRRAAAKAWSVWEGSTSKLYTDPELVKKFGSGRFADAFARIEAHYFVNGGFFETDGQLLRDARKLRKIPGAIVQGRYDVVCPATSAWDLHRAWPEAKLIMVPDAGHSMTEPGIRSHLIEETDRFAAL